MMWQVLLLLVGISLRPSSSSVASAAAMLYENNRNLCAGQPIITRKHEGALQWMFQNVGASQIQGSQTPQHEAACWMLRSKKSFSPQRFVMGVIYYATKGVQWDESEDWMSSKHECNWFGVECNMFGTVVNLDLGYILVDGLVPREIGLLRGLKDLDLHGNELQGVIPHRLLVGLKNLEFFRIQMNGMFGAIHKEITNMKNLKELYLYGNYISGTIPKEISKLKKLGYLDLHDNNFVGTMPKEICEKKLDMLVADCHGPKPEVK
ncbi:MAG: hypothetical protein SGBAC_013455, partial [Bacillariaceae sp.]